MERREAGTFVSVIAVAAVMILSFQTLVVVVGLWMEGSLYAVGAVIIGLSSLILFFYVGEYGIEPFNRGG